MYFLLTNKSRLNIYKKINCATLCVETVKCLNVQKCKRFIKEQNVKHPNKSHIH